MAQSVPSSPVALSVSGLAIARGGVDVVSGFSAEVADGEALILRGPNGAGKSSTLLALGGHIGRKSGTIQWVGFDPERRDAAHMHFLGHLSAVQKGLSVRENLVFWTRVLGGDAAGIDTTLAAAGLDGLGALPASVLSAGQTRRLALARLIAVRRPVWLLDEPTAALDAQGADWVNALLSQHLDQGGMAVVATHLPLAVETDPRVRAITLERPVH